VGWVLFAFESPGREAGARRTMADATVPVATSTLSPDSRPYSAVWRPVADRLQYRLADLGYVPVPASSRQRVHADALGSWKHDGTRRAAPWPW